MSISREELYTAVWAEPVAKVAARYEVSGSFLARICRDLNVPRPERGYWARLAFGKEVVRPPLPSVRAGDFTSWSPGAGLTGADLSLRVPEPKKQQRRRKVAERPAHHPLTVGMENVFVVGWVAESGHLRPRKRALVDLFVTKKELGRALGIANALFLSLEDRGHRVMLAPTREQSHRPTRSTRPNQVQRDVYRQPWCPSSPTVVLIGTVAIGMTIFETTEEAEATYSSAHGGWVRASEVPPRKYAYSSPSYKADFASGKLAIRAFSPYSDTEWDETWTEKHAGDLQRLVPRIVKALERAAPAIVPLVEAARLRREEEHRRWEEQTRKWRREEAVKRRREAKKAATDELFAIIKDWAEASSVESFFADLDRRADTLPPEILDELRARIASARKLLGGTDALERFHQWRSPTDRLGRSDLADDEENS